MTVINIEDTGGTTTSYSSDLTTLVSRLASKLHGIGADAGEGTPGPDDASRTGKLFVDTVRGSLISMTWALPNGRKWSKAATMELTLGHGSHGTYVATLVTILLDGRSLVGTSAPHRTPAAAATEALTRVLGDPWCTLCGHVYYDDTMVTHIMKTYRWMKKLILWTANIATTWYLIHLISRGRDDAYNGTNIVGPQDVAMLFGIALVVLLIITLLRRTALDALHAAHNKALLKYIKS